MTTEDNGNVGLLKPTSSSNEDLSEYTDADESISAPTEFLAEFLSAVMLKDYLTALKYCKLTLLGFRMNPRRIYRTDNEDVLSTIAILQYEPNNATAKEFYPLILEKLQQINADDGSSNENESEDEDVSEGNSSNSSTSSDNTTSSEESSEGQAEEEEDGVEVEQSGGDKQSKGSSDGDATTGSYSSLEDDEAETVDQLAALAARYQIDNVNLGNGNKIYGTQLTAFQNKILSNTAIAGIGGNSIVNAANNQMPFGTSSDSESPTEPVSQQTVAMLRARVVPTKL